MALFAQLPVLSTKDCTSLAHVLTSTPMPKLLGEDWSHLFPEASVMGHSPASVFKTFQDELSLMAAKCEKYNTEAEARSEHMYF